MNENGKGAGIGTFSVSAQLYKRRRSLRYLAIEDGAQLRERHHVPVCAVVQSVLSERVMPEPAEKRGPLYSETRLRWNGAAAMVAEPRTALSLALQLTATSVVHSVVPLKP